MAPLGVVVSVVHPGRLAPTDEVSRSKMRSRRRRHVAVVAEQATEAGPTLDPASCKLDTIAARRWRSEAAAGMRTQSWVLAESRASCAK
jgi:hypothetical protein